MAEIVNGYSAQQANYSVDGDTNCFFMQTGPLAWKAVEPKTKREFRFVEVGRDEWSIYLHDQSRKVSIQIDLFKKKIRFSDATTPFRDQYDVSSAASVVGWLVGYAQFSLDAGQFGEFLHTGAKTWKEVDSQGNAAFQFVETGRDDWSVYLHDQSRKVSIQIDLFRRKIRFSDATTPWRDQYDLSNAKSVVGWTAGMVVFSDDNGQRSFIQTHPNKWDETNIDPASAKFNFDETDRDDWSVYLKDPSRNVSIQLDLFRSKVRYSDATTPWRDQYDVLRAAVPFPGQVQPDPAIKPVAPPAAPGLISPGFIIKNETIWPLQISLNQVGPLYFDVVQPGQYFVRDTGAVWFTIKAAVFLDEKDRITEWNAILPVAAIVGTVILSAVTAGAAAYAGGPALAAAGMAGISGVSGLSSAGALATATAASGLVGAGFSASAALVIGGAVVGGGAGTAISLTTQRALTEIFSPGNTAVSEAGAYAGPPWPFRTGVTPWKVTGGPTFRQVPGKDQVEIVGGALKIGR